MKNIAIFEGCSIKEKWAVAELVKLKGGVKEAHSRAYSVIKQAKKDKMKATARNRVVRRENRVHDLIDTVDASVNKVNSEESAVFVEGVGGQLTTEVHILNTEIEELAILDPGLGDRAEKLRCAATASAVKAVGSVRKFRNDDGAVNSKCSAGSFVPKTKVGASATLEEKEKTAFDSQAPKSDAQKSKEASEARSSKQKPDKKSSSGREHRKREPSPSSDDSNSSGSDKSYSMASKDAEGYDRDRCKYNEEHLRWQGDRRRDVPRGGGDDRGDKPEEPPAG